MDGKTVKTKKIRAINSPDNQVGMQRKDLYKNASIWIKIAMSKGFNLEAITLVESMISDRLESRLSQLLGEDFSFKTLGKLISAIEKHETDARLKELVSIDLDNWRNERNEAIHGMLKLADGDTRTWQNRMDALALVASNGVELSKRIKARVSSLKNFKHKNGF